MTILRAISKGILVLTAASSLLAGLPRYDCLCATTKAQAAPAAARVSQEPLTGPSFCCCGTCCSQGSADGTSCCGNLVSKSESTNCCEQLAAADEAPGCRITGYGCQRLWSTGELAVVPAVAHMKVDSKGVVA